MNETELNHDDIARDMEQQINGVTYCESEGTKTTRVDFGQNSIWFSCGIDYVHVTGNMLKRNKRDIDNFLKSYKEIKNEIKYF